MQVSKKYIKRLIKEILINSLNENYRERAPLDPEKDPIGPNKMYLTPTKINTLVDGYIQPIKGAEKFPAIQRSAKDLIKATLIGIFNKARREAKDESYIPEIPDNWFDTGFEPFVPDLTYPRKGALQQVASDITELKDQYYLGNANKQATEEFKRFFSFIKDAIKEHWRNTTNSNEFVEKMINSMEFAIEKSIEHPLKHREVLNILERDENRET